MTALRPIEVGDRFEDKDPRNAGRVVEVREVDWTGTDRHVKVQVEVHPKNPSAVGHHSWLSAETVITKYRRISR